MTMDTRASLLALALAVGTSAAHAQAPMPFSQVTPASSMDAPMRAALQAKAGAYPLVAFAFFGRDSAVLVFEDSTMTAAALVAHKWMFGPPVTVAEADGCPPEKVLGRRIARVLWRERGRPESLQHVVVAVRGTSGIDRWTAEGMHYYREQLVGRWAGDPDPK